MNKRILFTLIPLLILLLAFKTAEKRHQIPVTLTQKIKNSDTVTSISGVWRMDIVQRGNVTLSTYFIIHSQSGKFSGSVIINGAVKLQFLSPHFVGNEAVFGTDWNRDYRLHRDGAKLHVTIVYGVNSSQQAYATRVSEAETNAPEFIPLPSVVIVPPNGLAQTPPMGWNSWNHFGGNVDDAVVRAAADRLISSGLAAAGYNYINIDDSWEGGRDENGNIMPNQKFPDMKALADYVHARGLKLGIYSSPGPLTCGGYVGSYGHEQQDAKTYASWGIDYLKYDWCRAERIYTNDQLQAAYQKMGSALAGCGPSIVYSLCEYGIGSVWQWGAAIGANLWRTTGDIKDNWESMSAIGFRQVVMAPFAGPGHWNDPDMLEVGNGGMSNTEYRMHFSLWCMLAAQLMAGNDLRRMSPGTLDILSNKEVIAIDQDPLGQQGVLVIKKDPVQIWVRDLKDGSKAVGLFNIGITTQTVTLKFSDIKLAGTQNVRDLWLHKNLGKCNSAFKTNVDAHGVVFLKVIPLIN